MEKKAQNSTPTEELKGTETPSENTIVQVEETIDVSQKEVSDKEIVDILGLNNRCKFVISKKYTNRILSVEAWEKLLKEEGVI